MNQAIEHVTDPVRMLQGVARILKPRGRVVLTAPNIQGAGARVFGEKSGLTGMLLITCSFLQERQSVWPRHMQTCGW
jgi:2-polyprenyl-3-methyl-5-hydroxy-6-metoxy-1,4-benzoquinol methylase